MIGAHLEGPFLSAERPGMHPVEHMRAPDLALLDRLLDAGPVTEMTLAPELPGADALVRRLRERGVVVSAGHTNATAEEANRGFDLGIAGLTHVFNAMRPLRSRDPGVAGAALTRPDVVVKMIVDGHHLARETVQLVWACAAGRVALITDAMAAAGAGGGTFRFGEVEIEVEAGAAPMLEDGTLAGSVLTMIDAVRNLHALGVPFEQAVGAATEVPARLLGRDDIGVLEPGGPADIVVLDDRLEIQTVLCAGTEASWLETEAHGSAATDAQPELVLELKHTRGGRQHPNPAQGSSICIRKQSRIRAKCYRLIVGVHDHVQPGVDRCLRRSLCGHRAYGARFEVIAYRQRCNAIQRQDLRIDFRIHNRGHGAGHMGVTGTADHHKCQRAVTAAPVRRVVLVNVRRGLSDTDGACLSSKPRLPTRGSA